MTRVESKIEVNQPIQTVYNQWTQFEDFPLFMEGVREVRQIDNERLFWSAEIGGETKEWHARITQQIPDTIVAWVSEDGASNEGTVMFRRLGNDRTEIELRMDFEPSRLRRRSEAASARYRRAEGDFK